MSSRIRFSQLLSFSLVAITVAIAPLHSCRAQEDACTCCEDTSTELATPDYSGCLWCRSSLTGDWKGCRSSLAQNGITFRGDVTQYYQGVASGGLEQHFKYGGHSDYVFDFDMGKVAGVQGTFIKLRGESQFGEFINFDTGAISAANTSGLVPTPEEQATALTEFVFTQFLSEQLAVFAGKLQTLDGDQNAFAHGRGKTQFMNASFVANPVAYRTVPYSSLGAGFVIFRDRQPVFSFTAIDPVDRATTFDLDEVFEEGVSLIAETRLPTNFWGLPGHQLVGGVWSSRDVALLSQNPRLLLPPFGLPLQRESDSWALFWNFDQYLVVDPCDPTKGWGVFGRAAIADDDTNPLEWFLSFGVGGNSSIRGREADTFGVGWYYAGNSDQLPPVPLGDHGQGVELFYNVAVTPWLHITGDLQVIDPSTRGVDNALVCGIRVKMDL